MLESHIRVTIITNILPSYREGFYNRLLSIPEIKLRVYCQDKIPGADFKTIHGKYLDNVTLIKYISARNEKIVWQFLPWRQIISESDVIFIGGNPRVLSDVVLGIFLRLIGKKVVLWTMAHSYKSNMITERVRLFWTRLFKVIFVYTDNEVDYLEKRGFSNKFLLGMNNGLDQRKIDRVRSSWTTTDLNEWIKVNGFDNNILLLSCARLVSKNRFELFIAALPAILKVHPTVLWCIIGDGDYREYLNTAICNLGLEKNVKFLGEIHDENKLAPWFLSSQLFIHPAAIGLSLLHSFGYGLPVITHERAELHGPEYAAFTDGLTGKNFIYENVDSLSKITVEILSNIDSIKKMKEYSLLVVENKYNVDIMVSRFLRITEYAFRN